LRIAACLVLTVGMMVFCACVPRVEPELVAERAVSRAAPWSLCPFRATDRCGEWTVGACLPPDLDPGRVHFRCAADCFAGGNVCHFTVTVDCPCPGIFADGFETGDLSVWSSARGGS